MRIEILGTPVNGLGSPPDIENPAEGLRLAGLVPLLASSGDPADGASIACYHPVLDADGSAGSRLVTLISDVLSSRA